MSLGLTYQPTPDPKVFTTLHTALAMNETLNSLNTSTISTSSAKLYVYTLDILLSVLDSHAPFAVAVNKCVTPIWYIIGTLGNLLSAAIWLNPRLRSFNSAAYYLTTLAIADELCLVLHVFYELENPWLIRCLNLQGWCQTWNMLYMAAQYTCVLLVFAFTVERFLSICHPFKSERFSRKTRSPKVILCIVILSILLASPQAYFWEVTTYSSGDSECQVRISETLNGENSFYSIWSWGTEMIVFGVVPLLVLLANVCVLKTMRHVGKLKFKDSVTTSVQSSSSSSIRYTSTTITLLWVSFFLIFTTLPVTVTFAMQSRIKLGPSLTMQEMGEDPTWKAYFSYYTVRTVIKEIGMSHHVFNVFIYCLTSKRFRSRIVHIVVRSWMCSKKSVREESWRNPSPMFKETSKICMHSR